MSGFFVVLRYWNHELLLAPIRNFSVLLLPNSYKYGEANAHFTNV
jgi:hypothetical protein